MARWLAAFALTSALAAGASAHEPPKGIDLQWSGDAPDELPVIVTNRGLVFADAMGGTTRFSLRCAEAYGANTSDHPGVSVGADGQITIGIYNGVSATSDRACSLHPSAGLPDEPLGRFVPSSGRLLLSTRTFKGYSAVLGSSDGGGSWAELFENPTDQYYDSLVVARSDAQRVYAAGQRADRVNQKLIYLCSVSSDGGASWEDQVLPAKIIPFAVHPSNPDVVFAYQATDAVETTFNVVRSSDRGAHFEPVLEGVRQPTALAGASGALWLGIGGEGGLYRSDDDGEHFEQVQVGSVQSVSCLMEREGRLWMCANMAPNTNGIWYSDDGAPFEKLLTFEEVRQPVMCDDLEAQVTCSRAWYDFDIELHPPSPDAGTSGEPDAGAPEPDAGVGSDAAMGPDPEAGDDAGVSPAKRSSGGCQAAPLRSAGAAGWWLALAALAVPALWRRKAARGDASARA